MAALSKDLRIVKLRQLAKAEGYACVQDMLLDTGLDSVSPAICVEAHCEYTTGMEPDQDRGYCEACGGNTVVSAAVLAGVI